MDLQRSLELTEGAVPPLPGECVAVCFAHPLKLPGAILILATTPYMPEFTVYGVNTEVPGQGQNNAPKYISEGFPHKTNVKGATL